MSDKKESSLLTVVVILVFIAAVFIYKRDQRTPTPGGTSTNVVNPTHVQFESLDHDTVTSYEFDVIDVAAGTVVQTIVVPKASTLVQAAGVEAPLKLYPLTPGTYQIAVRARVAAPVTGTSSPDNTRVPPAPSITDDEGAVWTIAADGLTVLRNGQNAGGRGSPLLWHMGGIYVLGTDANWWQYLAGGGWVNVGPTDPANGATAQPGVTAMVASSPTSAPSNEWTRGPIAVY